MDMLMSAEKPVGPLSGLVAVLLPVRDGEREIVPALDRLRERSAGARVVVVDDGSIDATSSLVRRFFPDVFLLSCPRRGLAHALNAGLQAVQEPFVARIDVDDELVGDRFSDQASLLQDNPAAVLCVTACRETRGDSPSGVASAVDDFAGQGLVPVSESGRFLFPPTDGKELRRVLLRRNPIVHGTVMFRREAVLAVGGYDESFPVAQDYDLWLRLTEKGEVVMLPQIGYIRHPPVGQELRVKRRRQAWHSARAQWKHFRRTGRVDAFWLLRNLASSCWTGPRRGE